MMTKRIQKNQISIDPSSAPRTDVMPGFIERPKKLTLRSGPKDYFVALIVVIFVVAACFNAPFS